MQIIALTAEDADRAVAVDQSAFFFDPAKIDVRRETAIFDWPRTFGAVHEEQPHGRLAGLYTSFPMAVAAPGPLGTCWPVPMAGLSWVSVHPDERRRGVLRSMISHHFAQLHRDGEHLAGLHAAEAGIYGRFGYAVASLEVTLTLEKGTTITAPALDDAAARVQTRISAMDDPSVLDRLQALHHRAATTTAGTVTRGETYLRGSLVDRPEWRIGREPDQVLFASVDGEDTGFAVFHRVSKWESAVPGGTMDVLELTTVDAPSLLALARRLVDFDLIASTTFSSRSLDDPLIWWTGGPRGKEVTVHDGLWLRLVDVGAALEARGWSGPCDLVIDVVDEVCEWNHGRWRLTVDQYGSAQCSRTEADADVHLPVQALGAAYLGGRTLVAQQFSGVVQELVPGALLPLSRAMSSDRDPVGAVEF